MDDMDREVLAFERQWFKYAGSKEQAIRDAFGWNSIRYAQHLNRLVDTDEALIAEPMLVKRLRKLRAERHAQRAPRRVG